VRQYILALDQFSQWRKHQVWAHRDGEELKNIISQRFASNTIFLSLLISTEVGILFTPSEPGIVFREHLKDGNVATWGFWSGIILVIGVFVSICALYTTFVV
jgi:hypothetical protein